MMTLLSDDVLADIKQLVNTLEVTTPSDVNGGLCEQCASGDYCAYVCDAMQLTVACDQAGTSWNYQTGDNSFTGGAYSLPHWAVVHVTHDCCRESLYNEIIDELSTLIESDI